MKNRKFEEELLQILNRTITALTSQINLPELLEEIFRQIKHFIAYSAGSIYLFKEESIYHIYSIGYEQYGGESFVNLFSESLERLPFEKEIFNKKKPLLISDTLKYPKWIRFPETSWIRSRLSLPLIFKNRVIGILNLDSNLPANFSQKDLNLLLPLTSAIAVALENARLFEELKASEDRYKTVFEYSGTALVIIEEDTTLSMVNKQFEHLSGYSKNEIEGKMSWQDFVVPEDLERMRRYHQQRRMPGRKAPEEYEFRFIDKNGRVKDIFIKSGVIPGTKKSVASLLDITDRKQAELKLKESEEHFKLLFDYAPVAYCIMDLEGTFVDCNRVAEELIGYPKEELIGKNLFKLDIINPINLPKFYRLLQDVQQGKMIGPEELVLRGEDQTKVIVEFLTYLVKFGPQVLILVIVRDITRQKSLEKELKRTLNSTILTISKLLETKDSYTFNHQKRVCQLAVRIAKELKLPREEIKGIRIASLIHDIGKISIPVSILTKPTRLNTQEFSLIQGHPQIGYEILKSFSFPYPLAQIILQHHERWNGSGYPQRLKGEDILLEARIIGVADVVEAMSSFRPYRPALGIEKALEEISRNKGILYDPKVVEICLYLFREKGFKF